MPIFTFHTSLLSAQKTGNPNLTNTTLSGGGVAVIALSTNDNGITFTTNTLVSNTAATLVNVTIDGSLFRIDQALNGQYMAVVKAQRPHYNVFPFISAMSFVPTSALSASNTSNIFVNTPNTRRKRNLGY